MNGEARPQLAAALGAKVIGERLLAMGVEVVHHQMNGFGCRIALGNPFKRGGKTRRRAVGGSVSVMASPLGRDDAEDVGGAAPRVL